MRVVLSKGTTQDSLVLLQPMSSRRILVNYNGRRIPHYTYIHIYTHIYICSCTCPTTVTRVPTPNTQSLSSWSTWTLGERLNLIQTLNPKARSLRPLFRPQRAGIFPVHIMASRDPVADCYAYITVLVLFLLLFLLPS